MELSERKRALLTAVIRDYVHTGEPVGSKVLCDALGGLSSATIRNEMSDLADMGYLDQPHTSAGRVPTLKAFRLYIDALMQAADLPFDEQRALATAIADGGADGEHALSAAGVALAKLTGCAAITTSVADSSTTIHGIELMPMSLHSGLIVLVTSAGAVHSKLCRFSAMLTPQAVELFMKLTHEVLIGTELATFNPASVQTLIASLGERGLELVPLISALAGLIEQAGESQLSVYGQANLLGFREFSPQKARQIFDLFTRRDEVISLLSRRTGVIFGGETCFDALDTSSLVVARYRMGNRSHTGYIGVIGPTRMNYDRIIPSINFAAELLGAMGSN